MIALLAGIAIVMLVVSEIAAVAPSQFQRPRRILLWSAIPVLVLFAVVWLIDIRMLLTQGP